MTEQKIHKELAKYATHGLKDLVNASLMRRVDTKFMVAAGYVPELLRALSGQYSSLQIDNQQLFRYTTTYYDTPEMLLYHLHHGGRLNRHKVRAREYHDTDTAFLEVKFKDSRRVTTKKRVEIPAVADSVIRHNGDFLDACGVPVSQELVPVQVGSYRRLALANEASGERVTIDLGLCYARPTEHGQPLTLDRVAIIEIKQGRFNRNSPTIVHLQRHGFRPTSFSKYCIGQCLTLEEIKANRFKRTLRNVAKLQNQATEVQRHARAALIGH